MSNTKKPVRAVVSAIVASVLGMAGLDGAAQDAAPAAPPAWAFPILPSSAPPAPAEDGTRKSLPGSRLELTMTQLFDLFKAWDWYPDMHPPMPEVVEQGRKPEVRACGMCHMPNGQGRPENASLAGLPAAYIEQQMADWKAGKRRSSQVKAGPQIRMTSTAEHATPEEAKIAAEYFSKLTYKPWIRVVETHTVPRTEVIIGAMWAPSASGGTEPIGQRIIEVPENLARTELRDPTTGFVAYVPVGSIAKGEKIVMTGGDRTQPCTSCHGPQLKGMDAIPPLAGRSTTYIVRQLWDIQHGARAGAGVAPMKDVVAKLSLDDMIAIAAYLGSRAP